MDGTWEPIGGLQEEDTADEIGLSFESLEMLATLVDPANSYVWAFTGKTVPRTRNAVLKSPRAARVIFNVDEGDVNVLDIAKTHAVDYPLGDEEVTVYVLQEFKADFVQELDDVRHDPIEVTLDKNVKKELLTHLSLLSGGQDDDKYWEACISEHVELQSEVFMDMVHHMDQTSTTPPGLPADHHNHQGQTSTTLHGLPADHHNHQGQTSTTLHGLPADHHNHQGQTSTTLHGLPADHHNRQGQPPYVPQVREAYQTSHKQPPQLPEHDGLNEQCRSLRKTGSRAKWGQEQGFVTMLCVDPLRVPLHEVGPGQRSLRWTAIRDGDAWRWVEKAQVGKLDANIVDAEATIIFYGWDKYELATRPEGDHQTFAETFDISTQEKRAIPFTCQPRTPRPG